MSDRPFFRSYFHLVWNFFYTYCKIKAVCAVRSYIFMCRNDSAEVLCHSAMTVPNLARRPAHGRGDRPFSACTIVAFNGRVETIQASALVRQELTKFSLRQMFCCRHIPHWRPCRALFVLKVAQTGAITLNRVSFSVWESTISVETT